MVKSILLKFIYKNLYQSIDHSGVIVLIIALLMIPSIFGVLGYVQGIYLYQHNIYVFILVYKVLIDIIWNLLW